MIASRTSPILDEFGGNLVVDQARRTVYASQISSAGASDLARAGTDNERLFRFANGLSADASISKQERESARNKCRYEFRNNSYCNGIVRTLAYFVIGTGPRLQLHIKDRRKVARQVEERWEDWAAEVCLAESLTTGRQGKATDGEDFMQWRVNDGLSEPLKFGIYGWEADYITTPTFGGDLTLSRDNLEFPPIDGIEFDRWGNKSYYHKLLQHPGSDRNFLSAFGEYERVPAEFMVHWYRQDRRNQSRGFCELEPCIGLFAELRRYREAVIRAAEQAADFSWILKTNLPPDNICAEINTTDDGAGLAELHLSRGTGMQLPEGWEPYQMKAEQPTTVYGEFVSQILREAYNCLLAPWNVASGDSSDYNFASGRLDYQKWDKAIDVERSQQIEKVVLHKIFSLWFDAAVMIPGYLPGNLGPINLRRDVTWAWDEREPLDIAKYADHIAKLSEVSLYDEAEYWARKGQRPEDAHERMKELADHRKSLGLPPFTTPKEPQRVDEGTTQEAPAAAN